MRQFLLAAAIAAAASPALAQAPQPGMTPQDQQQMMRTMHLAGRNQLGIMQYCQAQGAIGADVVALQRRALGMLPPAQVDGLEEAEATGRRGVVAFGPQQIPMADAAKAQNTSVDAMCKQIAQMLQSQASQIPR